MNERVIEAAEEQIAETLWRNGIATSDLDMLHEAAESAVTAALAALAPDIRSAVDNLGMTAFNWGDDQSWEDHSGWEEQARAARRDLLALLGIPEDGA